MPSRKINPPLVFAATAFFILLSTFLACKKTELPPSPAVVLTIDADVFTLKNDDFFGRRLTAKIENLPAGESDSVIWKSENPRIASVTNKGVVWPEAAGETYIVATLANGKATAKCKAIITDGNDYKFRIVLKDKGQSGISLTDYRKFISEKAFQRRNRYNIKLDESDLPISQDYLNRISQVGGTIVVKSKWLNTVTVNCQDEFLIDKYKELPFVKDVILVYTGKRRIPVTEKYVDEPQIRNSITNIAKFDYGTATSNITVNNGQYLHEKGFKGAGIDIAVIDAGFINMKTNPLFSNVNLKGAKSFVFENDNPYAIDNHGIWVTSCMAVNQNGTYVGTAPEANYWLFRTEDSATEYPVEEDYWVAAAEYADSVGVDMINSSLSYTTGYYFPEARYKFEQMDGKTAFATRGANVAASKGILIFNCAGNEMTWVGAPADSPNVMTIGGVSPKLTLYGSTSNGITVDGRIKPDVMAVGALANVVGITGVAEDRSGTSYASPILCGLAACLWQAYPKLTNLEIMQVMRKESDKYSSPILPWGYGITNMQAAYNLAADLSSKK